MTHRFYLNDDWLFTEQFEDSLTAPEYPENTLQPVRLPHTCKETPFHYFDESLYQMVSGYRRHLLIPEDWQGKQILLTFEGAAHDSTVFCNGKKVGAHHCGYTAFTVDLTNNVLYGQDNLLCIRLDSRENLNVPPFGYVIDYMTYGGIYRDVRLEVKEKVSLSDIFVHTAIDFRSSPVTAQITSEITLTESNENITIRQYYMPKNTAGAQESWNLLCEQTISADTACDKKIALTAAITDPLLWDTEEANLYILKTQLYQDNTLLDETKTTFGIREAVFKKDGFYLNGRKVRIRGLNRHQSYPYVGYAMPESMQKLDADLLKKELGLNAVRTSHYPQSHHFLSECDRLGLLVFTEIPGWQHIGGEDWKNQARENTREMVLQYRNHPSIVLWGVRINESRDDDELYQATNEIAWELDPSRATSGVRNFEKSHLLEDVYSYNDFSHCGDNPGCKPRRSVTGETRKAFLISEHNGHMFPTKSFDTWEKRQEQALRHMRVLSAAAADGDHAGCFGWCMFDYQTHPDFGSGDRICYHGVMDAFRNPKTAAFAYASQG